MTRLISAEAFKLRRTRTSLGLAAGALAIVVVVTAATALTVTAEDVDPGRQALAAAGIAQAFALVLGVLAVTTEFRHGTITPTLLVAPDRQHVLLAKLAALVLAGLALGLVAFTAATAIALPVLASRDVPSELAGADVVAIVAGGTVGAGLFAALGVAVGALVRNQVGAVIAALGWLYVLEQLLAVVPGIGDVVRQFGFAGLSSGLSATASADPDAELLAQLPAGLVLAGYVALLLAGGTRLLRLRDVTR